MPWGAHVRYKTGMGNKAVRKLILNARLAGASLGLPGENRMRAAGSATPPAVASQPLFVPPVIRSRDYELLHPFAEKHIPVTDGSLSDYMVSGFSAMTMMDVSKVFSRYGLSDSDLKSGRTYLFISAQDGWGQPLKPVYQAYHDHVGEAWPANREFMIAMAAHESSRFQADYGRNRADIGYRQNLVVIPPHDPETGKIPWFEHKDGAGWEFNWYLHNDKSWQRMGKDLAARLLQPANWQQLFAQPAVQDPVDYMKAVRRSCGDLREKSGPV